MAHKTISNKAYRTIILHTLFTAATILSGSFVYILLWRLRDDFSFIALFDFYFVSMVLVGYLIASKLLTYIRAKNILRLSFLILIVAYAFLLHLQADIVHYIVLFGLLNGLGNGLYWGTYNLMQITQTTSANREHYAGTYSGLFTTLAAFAPALTGLLITIMPSLTNIPFAGYYLLYALALGILLFLLGFVEAVPSFKLESISFKDALDIANSKKFRNLSVYSLLTGFFETGSNLVLIIFSFILLGTELNFGLFISAVGVGSAVYVYFIGKKMNVNKRSSLILLGALLILAGRLAFAKFLSVEALVIDRAFFTLGNPLFLFPAAAIVMNAIEARSKFNLEQEQQFLLAKEIPLGFGRLFGSLFFIIFLGIVGSQNLELIRLWFLSLAIIPLLQWFFVRKI